jgi:trimeric autotransporter adhesin
MVGVLSGCAGGGSNSTSGGGTTTPTPAVTSVSPSSVPAGSSALTLTVSGSGFLSSSVVQVGGTPEATAYVSATQLTATVPATQLASGAEVAVFVLNGGLSSGAGTAANLEVDNPAPTIASISPTVVLAGAASAVVTFTGTGFVPTTVINVNGSARATTFINSTQVSAALPSTDFAAGGTLSLTAVNPTPEGGTSAATPLTVNNPVALIAKLSPSSLNAGATTAATVTVTGPGFVPTSTVQVNGVARATTYVDKTTLTFAATVADQANVGTLAVTVKNPAPGGGVSAIASLSVIQQPATPVITSISPTSIIAGSPTTSVMVSGTGFTSDSVVQWNGMALATFYGGFDLYATVPASDLTTVGTATVTVNTPSANPSGSNAVTLTVSNPPVPTLTNLYPSAGPINAASAVTLTGTGFTGNTTVALNSQTIPSTFVSSTQLTATFPASDLALPGNVNVTVTTPAPGGGTSTPQAYTTYISLPNNDLVYNPADGLLYASVPVSVAGAPGNSVVGIDPYTGSITRQIFVGTTPNKLALSTDGTQLFVGIDGSGAVAQVDLAQGKVVNQFSLGGGPGVYNAPYTASYLSAVPGSPNSVAVATTGYINGNGVTIFDSGVARAGSSTSAGEGPLSFGSSASTLYLAGSSIETLSVASTGVTGATPLYSPSYSISSMQYDNGRIYLSNGAVVNASTGALSGTFYTAASSQANGPVVSDSTLGRAFIGETGYSSNGAVYAFDETTFNLIGSIPVNGVGTSGYPTSFRKIVRWGQNGIALAAIPSAFTTNNQIYIFQSPLVKDLSASPADLAVSLTAPATATTGTAISYVATVSNSGPNAVAGATLAMSLPSSLIINSITTSQGSCSTGTIFACDLGGLANGSSAIITVNATPMSSGTLAGTASASSTSYDPAVTNNQANVSTTATGGLYGAVPSVSAITPNAVQASSADFTLTVTGTGFNATSTVYLGTNALATTYVSFTQLTAIVTAAEIANYGWAPVTISNPTPGGGLSQMVPLTIYDLVNVPANSILFDPYAQLIYATVPSSSTSLTGNSVVSINPFTGVIGTPVAVGSQPTVMAETNDGNYLYISLSGANTVAQYDLLHQKLLQTVSFSGAPNSTSGATALAVMPGSDTTLAVDFSGTDGIMDISGSVGKFRTNFAGDNFPTFGDATHLYTYDNLSTGAEFYRYGVNANGLTLIDGTTLDGMGGFNGGFQMANGLVYGAGGGIANPSTTPPSQIATLPLFDFYGVGDTGPGVATEPDPSLKKDFLMLENTAGTWAYGLTRYDLTTYLPEAVLNMPLTASGVDSSWTMLRFGQDGLALLSYDSFGVTPAVSQMLLLRGPFVAPQELGTSTAASLSSSSATTIAAGSGNTMLTLTGSNFLPGVAVSWNGSYRTTTIVDSMHVTVAIPASDLASAGIATVVATNPGAPASNALQVTIN